MLHLKQRGELLPGRRDAGEAGGSDDEEATTVWIGDGGFRQVLLDKVVLVYLKSKGPDRVVGGPRHGLLGDLRCDILRPDIQPHMIHIIQPILHRQVALS